MSLAGLALIANHVTVLYVVPILMMTSSSTIAERPRCRVGQLWPKVEDDILQTV